MSRLACEFSERPVLVAAAVLAGLLGNTLLGWWWLDPAAALAIAAIAIREGIQSWRGQSCCAAC